MSTKSARPYVSPLRAEQAAATRDRIIDATVELLQGADPAAFGMQDVADRAGISVRTVYRAFATKEELLDGVHTTIRQRFEQIAGPPPSTRVEFDASITGAVQAVYQLEPLYRALFATAAGREAHQGAADARRPAFEAAFGDELAGLPEEKVRLVVSLFHLVTSSRSVLWLKDYAALDEDEAAEAVAWAVKALADSARRAER